MIYEEECPRHIKESLQAYVKGRPTGGFLEACLQNDLTMAVLRADSENQHLLPAIVSVMMDIVPANIRGSAERVAAHLKRTTKERQKERETTLVEISSEKPPHVSRAIHRDGVIQKTGE